jgi:hypothetical protein
MLMIALTVIASLYFILYSVAFAIFTHDLNEWRRLGMLGLVTNVSIHPAGFIVYLVTVGFLSVRIFA